MTEHIINVYISLTFEIQDFITIDNWYLHETVVFPWLAIPMACKRKKVANKII